MTRRRPFVHYFSPARNPEEPRVDQWDLTGRLKPGANLVAVEAAAPLPNATLAVQPPKRLLPRGVPYPEFTVWKPTQTGLQGKIEPCRPPDKLWKDRSLLHIGPKLKGFVESDLEVVLTNEAQLYAAGVLSNRQNVLDLFMACPSRERGGWQCDGFFTARGTADLTGATRVERNVFENYLLTEKFAHLPEGMLPMCYPADHYNGVFIPNWALWFVVQLGEYAERGGDPAIVAGLQPKVTRLFEHFHQYENGDGRLQATRNRTEACRYYAFFFDVASPTSHPALWRTLCEQFGPRRKVLSGCSGKRQTTGLPTA